MRCARTGRASGLHVVGAHVDAAAQVRARLGRTEERERAAGARAQDDVLVPARGGDDGEEVPAHRGLDLDVLDGRLDGRQVFARRQRAEPVERVLALPREEHRELLVLGRIPDGDADEEPIELRLGERIGALRTRGVLRRDDEERRSERDTCRRRRSPAPRSSPRASADCVRGEARLISSASRTFVKIGPRWNEKEPTVRVEHQRAEDVRRQQVGRELDAREPDVEDPRERLGERRLAHARHVLDEGVTSGEQRQQQQLDRLGLAADDPTHRGTDAAKDLAVTLDGAGLQRGGGSSERSHVRSRITRKLHGKPRAIPPSPGAHVEGLKSGRLSIAQFIPCLVWRR